MSYIKDELLEPYIIECKEGSYIVREDTGKVDKQGKPKEKILGWFTNKYAAYRRIAKCQVENSDLVRSIKEHHEVESNILRELVNKLGE